MDIGQIIFITSQLTLGAIAAFLAIMLWAKTRDVAWMLVVMGIITIYIEIVYSILNMLGVSGSSATLADSVPIVAIALPIIRLTFFIAAFLIMVIRRYRRH